MVTLLLTMGAELTNNRKGWTFMDYVFENEQENIALAVIHHDRFRFNRVALQRIFLGAKKCTHCEVDTAFNIPMQIYL